MDRENWLTVSYGYGEPWRIPESSLQKAIEAAGYMKEAAKKPGSGYTAEEAEEMYTLRIVKED